MILTKAPRVDNPSKIMADETGSTTASKPMKLNKKLALVAGSIILLIIAYVAYKQYTDRDPSKSTSTSASEVPDATLGLVDNALETIPTSVIDAKGFNPLQIVAESLFTLQTLREEFMEEALERLIRRIAESVGKPIGKSPIPSVYAVLKFVAKVLIGGAVLTAKGFVQVFRAAKPSALPGAVSALADANLRFYLNPVSSVSSVARLIRGGIGKGLGNGMGAIRSAASAFAANIDDIIRTARIAAKAATATVSILLSTSASLGIKKAIAMIAAKYLIGLSMGPIMWAIQAVTTACMLVDIFDPNMENERDDFASLNEKSTVAMCQFALSNRMTGRAWPPVASLQQLFPEEYEQATDEVLTFYVRQMMEYALNHPEEDEQLTVTAVGMAMNIPDYVVDEAIAEEADALEAMAGAADADTRQAKVIKTASEMMAKSPELRDAILYSSLVRLLTENGNRDFENAKRAPFWFFALSIPSSFYSGALDISTLEAQRKRGLSYSNLTVFDIKVTSEATAWGRTYIDIYRAKSPYFEERVRAYRVDDATVLEDIGDALIPEMPDIEHIAANSTAEYKRFEEAKFEDNVIFGLFKNMGEKAVPIGAKVNVHELKFGFRDDDNPASDKTGRAAGKAHSRWLAMCCFQQFLLQLAQHPGVLMDLGASAAAGPEGRIRRVRGVFFWKKKLYRAFPPRPWHEPRFVSLDLSVSRAGGSAVEAVYANEAAAFRWNECFEHQLVAGTVLADLRGISADKAPYAPVAVFDDYCVDVSMTEFAKLPDDRHPTPLKTRLIENTASFSRCVHEDGRVVFLRPSKSRVVRVIKNSEYKLIRQKCRLIEGVTESKLDADFRTIFGMEAAMSMEIFDIREAASAPDDAALFRVLLGDDEFLMCNANGTGQNEWLRKGARVIDAYEDVTEWPTIDEKTPNKDFTKKLRNMSGSFFKDGKIDGEKILGIFDLELPVRDTVVEWVWTMRLDKPPNVTVPPVLRLGSSQELRVRVYGIEAESVEKNGFGKSAIRKMLCYFCNWDNNINPNWEPQASSVQLAGKRTLFLPATEAYLFATYGMKNDDTLCRAKAKDSDLAEECGIYENYVVINSSGVPHTEMTRFEKGTGGGCDPIKGGYKVSFADLYAEEVINEKYLRNTFKTFFRGKVYILAEEEAKKRANAFCLAWKGENYKTIQGSQIVNERGDLLELGRCVVPTKQAIWEFLLGQTVTKMIARSIG